MTSKLQVIPAVANLAKNNNWWPGMPEAEQRPVAWHGRRAGRYTDVR